MKEWLAYAVVWSVLKFTGALPRPLARAMGAGIARLLFVVTPRLRKIAEFNLQLAFPEWTDALREATLRGICADAALHAREY
jgi:lauroyl/myristoyl acyltransferase